MSGDAQRDTQLTPFGAILAGLHDAHDAIVAAVFYDDEGETIDYHSYLDPFETRLAAAHHGVVIASATHRMAWLRMGAVEGLEIHAGNRDSVTLPVGGGTFLTVLAGHGALTPEVLEAVGEAVVRLRLEAGL